MFEKQPNFSPFHFFTLSLSFLHRRNRQDQKHQLIRFRSREASDDRRFVFVHADARRGYSDRVVHNLRRASSGVVFHGRYDRHARSETKHIELKRPRIRHFAQIPKLPFQKTSIVLSTFGIRSFSTLLYSIVFEVRCRKVAETR